MQYPLQMKFKLLALASQITVRDASGTEVFYVKQKLFKLKENVEVYKDSSKSQLIGNIKADRVIDFSPLFTFLAPDGRPLGTIKRNGRKSIWKASYDITINGQAFAHVRESNPWTKVWDALLSEVPIVGLISGHILNPKYIVENTSGAQIALLEKQPAFFEGVFSLSDTQLINFDEQSQQTFAALIMMTTLLERMRG